MLFQLYQKDATTSTVAPVASTCDCTNSQPNYLMNMYTKDATSTACSCDDTVAPVAPVVPTSPAIPVAPVAPSNPEMPVLPVAPSNPEIPVAPVLPTPVAP